MDYRVICDSKDYGVEDRMRLDVNDASSVRFNGCGQFGLGRYQKALLRPCTAHFTVIKPRCLYSFPSAVLIRVSRVINLFFD